jgi:hypothetical protein
LVGFANPSPKEAKSGTMGRPKRGCIVVMRVVRLGSPRLESEGTRIGTVRRPPRGVPKTEFASRNWYDVWSPNLALSLETMKLGKIPMH